MSRPCPAGLVYSPSLKACDWPANYNCGSPTPSPTPSLASPKPSPVPVASPALSPVTTPSPAAGPSPLPSLSPSPTSSPVPRPSPSPFPSTSPAPSPTGSIFFSPYKDASISLNWNTYVFSTQVHLYGWVGRLNGGWMEGSQGQMRHV